MNNTNTIQVWLKKLDPQVPDPVYSTLGSTGCDVHAWDDVILWPDATAMIRTGLCMEIPEGYECQIRPRSGLALKYGLTVLNSPSTIDCDYRGEIGVILHNTSGNKFHVIKGMRIAQFVFAPVTVAVFGTIGDQNQLTETPRGNKGFGFTGI